MPNYPPFFKNLVNDIQFGTANITVDLPHRIRHVHSSSFRNKQQTHYNTQHIENAIKLGGRYPIRKKSKASKRSTLGDNDIMTGAFDMAAQNPAGSTVGAG